MKNFFLGSLFILSCFIFTACGGSQSASTNDKKEVSSKEATVKVDSGTYVLQEGDSVNDGEGYLALDVSIKNNTKDPINIIQDDLNLYDKEGNKVANKNIYSTESDFQTLQMENLSGGKSTKGYVIFKVDKDKKYELHYAPMITDSEKKEKDIVVDVNTKDFKDSSDQVKKATEEYLNKVFLGKETDKKSELLSNDLVKEHNEFNQKFSEELKNNFDSYVPSDDEVKTLITKFEEVNQKKAEINYEVKALFPNKAVITVKPTVLSFDDVDASSIVETFVEQNEGKYEDYDKAVQDSEKYLIQQLPTKFDQTTPRQPQYMPKDGYKLILTKEKDKWKIDTASSSDNYQFDDLKSIFMGGLDE